MLKRKRTMHVGRIVLGACLLIALAGPAFAGTVYSWVTEDGTHAFTDDPKRIPEKHKAEASTRALGDLKRYDRYTVDRKGRDYEERLHARRSELREREVGQPIVIGGGAAGATGSGIVYNLPFNGGRAGGGQRGPGLQLPLAGAAGSDEPITVESVRVKPTGSAATRHWTIVKQGDRIISVFKGERRDRDTEQYSESDFDL
ncbi:MAG: DUF4124 domain-containing protein [Myxococcota bacterium]